MNGEPKFISIVKNVLSLKEAAVYLGISESDMYELTIAGVLPVYIPFVELREYRRKTFEDERES